jgi:hypothetical protein
VPRTGSEAVEDKIRDFPISEQSDREMQIAELHREALPLIRRIETIIVKLKNLGLHSLDCGNALQNIREHLRQASGR